LNKISPTILVGTLLLSGCAVQADGSFGLGTAPTICESYRGGDKIEQVEVAIDESGTPSLAFATPLEVTSIEAVELVSGDGRFITGGQQISINYAYFNATTGDLIASSNFNEDVGIDQLVILGQMPDFCPIFAGAREGSRLLTVYTPQSAHGGQGIAEFNLLPEDSVIFLFDVLKVYPGRAEGESRPQQGGFPTVVLTPTGQPGIQPLDAEPPTEFKRNILIEGAGSTLINGDTVMLHYTGWTWEGQEFDSTWGDGQPAEFVLSEGLIPGFVQALEGATVGSQVIAVIPPELAYGQIDSGPIPAGSTLVFVIDVLAKLNE
jgi:peptidylprolyl isomerase